MNNAAILLLALTAISVQGQTVADETKKPYRLEVVLDIGRHRLLTDVFRDQVRRELEEGLQGAYGDMARVAVIDSIEKDARLDANRKTSLKKLLAEVRKVGLQKPLDDLKEVRADGIKTHFVLIDYNDGQYEVQARQHDGLTGQASPVARRESTADRSFVSRLAAILVDRDFGLVGIIPAGSDPKNVTVRLLGGNLGADIGRWVSKGNVFIVVPVLQGVPQARRLEDSLLQIIEPGEKGTCSCRLLDRFGVGLKPNPRITYRCLKIHTISGPLHLRVMQAGDRNTPPAPGANVGVEVRHRNFTGEDASLVQGSTNDEGFFSSNRVEQSVYHHLAFVSLRVQKGPRVPVAIVDDRPAVVRIAQQVQDEGKLLAINKDLWEQGAYESGSAQQELFRELKDMETKPHLRDQALAKARQGLASSKQIRMDLAGERARLLKSAEKIRAKLDTSFGDGWLRFIDAGHVKLESYISEQAKAEKDEKDPKRLEFNAVVQQGKLEEGRLEFGKALEQYQKAIGLGFADEALKKYADQLSAQWKTRGEAHRLARNYIYETFPTANLVKDDTAIKAATRMFDECRKANDVLTPQKLLQEIFSQGGKMKEQEKNLQDFNEEDRMTAKVIALRAAELLQLGKQVQAYVQETAGK